MQPHDRTEDAELHPARHQFVVTAPEHVAADVMGPPAVADVGGCSGEFGLELEGGPGCDGVAGEADGVAVGAGTAVAGEDEGVCVACGVVEEVEVVEDPEWVDAGDFTEGALLPVDPPEVAGFVLDVAVEDFEVGFHESGIGWIEEDGRFVFGVVADGEGHFFV